MPSASFHFLGSFLSFFLFLVHFSVGALNRQAVSCKKCKYYKCTSHFENLKAFRREVSLSLSHAYALAHGGDHTGWMMRSKRQAGRRVHRSWSGEHVTRMTERWNVADGRHVSRKGGRVEGTALGEIVQAVMDLLALFRLARHFSVSGLDAFLLHSQGSVNLNKNQLIFLWGCCVSDLSLPNLPIKKNCQSSNQNATHCQILSRRHRWTHKAAL